MLPHLYPLTWESKGTRSSLDLNGWLFCQESACTAPLCAIAEGLAIATTLPGIRSQNTLTRHPNAMQASISGFSTCQTRCSSIKCSWIKAESQRSFMRVILQTRLSRELQLHLPALRLAIAHSRPDQGEAGSLLLSGYYKSRDLSQS